MIETHGINIFDAVVISIMLLSSIFAFYRGFVREVLSLSAWVGAGIVTLYYFQSIGDRLHPYFKKPEAAAAIGALMLFAVALIGFSIINTLIMKFIKKGTDVGMLDNLFGFLFGFTRGIFILSLGYFLLTIAIHDEAQYPQWLKKSITRPYIEKCAIVLARAAPEYFREASSLQKKALEEIEQDHANGPGNDNAAPAPQPAAAEPPQDDNGYKKNTTNQLDRLINSNNGNP